MMGLITSIFGGRPGMISGATGAMAVVMVSLVSEGNAMGDPGANMGLQYLFATLILAGLIQMAIGFFRMGKFIRMVPHSVMMGFVNGLAMVIFLSQVNMFKSGGEWLTGKPLFIMLGLVGLTMLLMYSVPKISKKVPAALVGIVVVSAIVIGFKLDTPTVKTFVQSGGAEGLKAGLPTFNVPIIPFNLETLKFILPFSFILALIGLVESLMTLTLVDELTETRGSGNRECVAQGAANIANGFFGGMGGCAMIGQSIINIKSGGRSRISGIVASVALLMFILFGSEYVEMIPIAALVGVMMMVVLGTFAWSTFSVIGKIPKADMFVILLVTVLTVFFDLAIAVASGVIVSALVFAWNNAVNIRANRTLEEHGVVRYRINGPLFFGSTKFFESKFDIENDPDEVVVDFNESRIMDQSAIEAINKLADNYLKRGKILHMRHLSKDCIALINRAQEICEVNILEDPDYYVAIDNYRQKMKRLGKV